MTIGTVSICDSCEYLVRPNKLEELAQTPAYRTPRCDAFPEGIPRDIYVGGDHRTVDPRQNNDVVHSLSPGKESMLQAWFEVAREIGVV